MKGSCKKCGRPGELYQGEKAQYFGWCWDCAVAFDNGCPNCQANPPWDPPGWIENIGGLCVYCHPLGIYHRPNRSATEILSPEPEEGDGFLDVPDWRG